MDKSHGDDAETCLYACSTSEQFVFFMRPVGSTVCVCGCAKKANMSIILFALTAGFLQCLVLRIWEAITRVKDGEIALVVVGDLGRSPRMRNHAMTISYFITEEKLRRISRVHLIGYNLSSLPEELTHAKNIIISDVKSFHAT